MVAIRKVFGQEGDSNRKVMDMTVAICKDNFDFDDVSLEYLRESMDQAWRNHRHNLYKCHIKGKSWASVRAAPPPPFLNREQWYWFMEYTKSEKFQAASKRNKANRSKLRAPNTLGRRSMAATRHVIAVENKFKSDLEVGRAEMDATAPKYSKARMEMGDSAKDDRAWIDLSFPYQRFIDGVSSFVKFVQVRFPDTETTQCPCNMCKNQRIPVPYEEVKIDLFKHGFNPAYKIWYLHGESETFEHADNESRFHDHQEDVYMDDFDELLINSMAQDSGGNLDACVQDKPNTGTQGENRFREVPPTELGNMPEYLNPLYNDFDVALGVRQGVLLSGPPGTGKTLFARTLTKESGMPFVFASGVEFTGLDFGPFMNISLAS
ncbi:hypothetical protein IFM89_039384 [Coptis chinensis]|uniref:Transposase-associated domain-containing protein n=1 Tax=Coptis chinensis TaxID=261450 RepID=A0A835HK52_9MAGN|nr:hypothetical protein IFM89_039384 [Coptis chinensis]